MVPQTRPLQEFAIPLFERLDELRPKQLRYIAASDKYHTKDHWELEGGISTHCYLTPTTATLLCVGHWTVWLENLVSELHGRNNTVLYTVVLMNECGMAHEYQTPSKAEALALAINAVLNERHTGDTQ